VIPLRQTTHLGYDAYGEVSISTIPEISYILCSTRKPFASACVPSNVIRTCPCAPP
jgi:hypothetical protein